MFLSFDAPLLVDLNHAELFRVLDRNRNRGDCRDGVFVDMEIDHLADVHAVDMVASENRDEIRTEILDQMRVLIDCVRSSHVPGFIGGLHLRRNRDDETPAHMRAGDVPSVDDVFHQALGFELRKDENAVDSAVDEVAEHKVDDSVFPSERNGRFGPLVCERCQPAPLASGQNHGKN